MTGGAGEATARVYLGWRLLKSDPQDVAFNVYRSTAGGEPVKLNEIRSPRRPISSITRPHFDRANSWFVRPVVEGQEKDASEAAELVADAPCDSTDPFL